MPRTMRLRHGHGAKATAIASMLQTSNLIRDKWTNTRNRERVEGMVLVGQDFRVVGRGGPETDAFGMRY